MVEAIGAHGLAQESWESNMDEYTPEELQERADEARQALKEDGLPEPDIDAINEAIYEFALEAEATGN